MNALPERLTRAEQVARMAEAGMTRKQIAEATGLRPNVVSLFMSRARMLGLTSVRWREKPANPSRVFKELPERTAYQLSLWLDADTAHELFAAAKRREMTLTGIVRAVLIGVTDDGMIDAVLDDGA